MILETIAIGGFVKMCYDADKSLKMDDKALAKYAKAFEKEQEANLIVKKKTEYMDKRLMNVAKKKRTIVENSIPKFIDVYSDIQKVIVENENGYDKITCKEVFKLPSIETMDICVKKNFTDKEYLCGFFIGGIGKLMVDDAQAYLSAANKQLRAANVIESQAESFSQICDAIVGHADRLSNLLMSMNALFIKSINETKNTIEKNGLDVKNYNKQDKGILMTCVNMAKAVNELVNIPLIDDKGELYQQGTELIETGENYLSEMKSLLN